MADITKLSKYFDLPLHIAAKKLGICTTLLKQMCRKVGIPRWPARKLAGLTKQINQPFISKEKKKFLKNVREKIIKQPSIIGSKNSPNLDLTIKNIVKSANRKKFKKNIQKNVQKFILPQIDIRNMTFIPLPDWFKKERDRALNTKDSS